MPATELHSFLTGGVSNDSFEAGEIDMRCHDIQCSGIYNVGAKAR